MAKAPKAPERRYFARIAALPCLVCGGQSTIHHVTGYADRMGRFSRSHKLVVNLCPKHHLIQHGPKESVEALGHRGFYQRYGVDLYNEAIRLYRASIAAGIFPHEDDKSRKIRKIPYSDE